MPTSKQRQAQDDKQRKRVRREIEKNVGAVLGQSFGDSIARLKGITDTEWQAAVEEEDAIIAQAAKGKGPGKGWWGPPRGTHGAGSMDRSEAQDLDQQAAILMGGEDRDKNLEIQAMQAMSEETAEIYGTPSRSEAATAHWKGKQLLVKGQDVLGRAFQKEISTSSLPRDEILYRGVHGQYAKELSEASIGDSISSGNYFSSTSRSQVVAEMFRSGSGILMRIRAAKGKPGLYVGPLASEIVLPAYVRLRVVGKSGSVIDMEYEGINNE